MQDFVAHSSPKRMALLVLGAAAFVAIGQWMIGLFGEPPSSSRYPPIVTLGIGWCCVLFFGLCGVIGLKRMLTAGEEVRIGAAGIRWKRWSDQTIPWSQIRGITKRNDAGQRTIVLHLADPARFPGRGVLGMTAGLNRSLTGGDIPLSLMGTDRSFDEALAAIQQFRADDPLVRRARPAQAD